MLSHFRKIATFALAVALCAILVVNPAWAQPTVTSEQAVLTTIPVKLLTDIAATVIPTPDGATGRNRGHGWINVTEQRVTDRLIDVAVVQHNSALVTKALLVANYAFAHQAGDGGFPAPNLTPVQVAGSSAFFIRDIAHSMLLLQQSSWFTQTASTASLRQQVAALTPKVQLGLKYLMDHQAELRSDSGGANRLIVYGGAFYLAGKLLSRDDAISVGRSFLQDAFTHQSSDGTFLEAGGFDSSYQNVSIYETEIIYTQLVSGDPMRDAIWQAIDRGYSREVAAIQPSGEVATLGNTRVGAQSVAAVRGGPVHKVDPIAVTLGFSYYAGITKDAAAKQRAASVIAYYFKIAS